MIKIKIPQFRLALLYVFCALCAALTSCQEDMGSDESLTGDNKLCFRLLFNDVPQSRAGIPNTHEVICYLADASGTIINNVLSDYHPSDESIVMEPLPNGQYQLIVLAFDARLTAYGFTLASGQKNVDDALFSFKDGRIPVIKDLFAYRGKIDFSVQDQAAVSIPITMHNIFAAVRIELENSNDYIKNSLQNFTISSPKRVDMYDLFTLSGKYEGRGEWDCDRAPIEDGSVVVAMPRITGDEAVDLDFKIETLDHRQMRYKNQFSSSCIFDANKLSLISIDMSKHPNARIGMIYATRSLYDSEPRPLILQDDEHKSVLYDANQRSFYIDNIVQLKLTDQGELHTRSYSPKSIKGASIWAKLPDIRDRVLLAYYDSIPAFCDARFKMQIPQIGGELFTDTGGRIPITNDMIAQLATSELTLESEDPYWLKVKQIQAHWKIGFASYGGDPDRPDGGITGNWKGLRPVHAREAIAIYLNIGYMVTLPEFVAWQDTFQGRLYGNGGSTDIIDVSTIIPKINNHARFQVGLVLGVGTIGLGGGSTWGVYQNTYVSHYTSTYAVNTAFHELGHCIGYNHSSSMSYGAWAGGCTDVFYVGHISEFPMNDYRILNSRSNPHLYSDWY